MPKYFHWIDWSSRALEDVNVGLYDRVSRSFDEGQAGTVVVYREGQCVVARFQPAGTEGKEVQDEPDS